MFVIFGANGNTGSVVAKTLLSQGKKVRVVARDASKVKELTEKGAEFFKGDLEDAANVTAALRGAEGTYLITPPDVTSKDFIGRGKKIAQNYAAGLAENEVPRAVLLSSVAAQLPSGTGPIVTAHNAEQILGKVAGTRLTSVRAAYFMENILANAHAIKDGVLPVFGGGESYPFPMIATRDIGEVSAKALLTTPAANEVIELEGPQPYSLEDAAKEASAIIGRPVKATALPIDQLVPTYEKFGFSNNVASLFREMTEAFGNGIAKFEGKGTHVKGRVTLAEVLRHGLS
jgi:uncharacterized protein YbjT (DUF2867 family)